MLDLLHDVEGGWLAKKYFFLEEGGRRYFFARVRRAHLRMPRIRLILQIKKFQGRVSQADNCEGKVIFCLLVSHVDRNTNYGMIQPPQLFFSCNSPASVGVLHLFWAACQRKFQRVARRHTTKKVRPHK